MKMFVITAVLTSDDTTTSAQIKDWLEMSGQIRETDKVKYCCVTGISVDLEENKPNVDIQHNK